MPICTQCGGQGRAEQRHCLVCHAAYMREWRKTHPLNAEQRKKDTARSYANVYRRRGKIIAEPCQVCGSPNVQMHHPDYAQPLEIEWLCKPHHREKHYANA